jgi:molecular chaperone GrpE
VSNEPSDQLAGPAGQEPPPQSASAGGSDAAVEPVVLTDPAELPLEQRLQLAERAAERDQFLDRMQRMQAEIDNVRKRLQREQADRLRQANARLIQDLLPVVDGLELAIASAGAPAAGSQLAAFLEGVDHVRRQFHSALAQHGLKRIEAVGRFDPALHEALMQVNRADLPNDEIAEVIHSGYQLFDRVLRPAQVAVNRSVAANED